MKKSLALGFILPLLAIVAVSFVAAPLAGCGCGDVGCESGVIITVNDAGSLGTTGLVVNATLAGTPRRIDIDLTGQNATCKTSNGDDVCDVGGSGSDVGIDLFLDVNYTDNTAPLDLTITDASGAMVGSFHGTLQTPAARPNGFLCGPTCHGATVTIDVANPT